MRNVTHGSGLKNVLDALNQHGSRVQSRGGYSTAQCPAHDDRTASLSLSQGEKGARLKCHAGCEVDAIRIILGLNWPDLFDNGGQADGERRTSPELFMPCQMGSDRREGCTGHKVAEYRYTDENGTLLFATCRCSRKGDGCAGFAQWQPDSSKKHGKRWSIAGVRRVIYQLPEVLKAIEEGRPIYFVEGEKDADLIRSKGETATSSPMGAGSWLREYAKYFRGAVQVIIVADADEPGLAHAQQAFEDISKFAENVKVVCSPVDMKGADTTNHFSYGLGFDDFEVVPFEKPEGRPQMVIRVEERHAQKPVPFEGFSQESVQEQLVGSMLKYGTGYDISEADIRNDDRLAITVAAVARIDARGSVVTPETVAAEIEEMGKGSYGKVLPYLYALEEKAFESTEKPGCAAQVLRERSIRYGIVWSLRAAAEAAMKENRTISEVLEYLGRLTGAHVEEFAQLSYQYGTSVGDSFTGDLVEEVAREEGLTNFANVRELHPVAAQGQKQTAAQRG